MQTGNVKERVEWNLKVPICSGLALIKQQISS